MFAKEPLLEEDKYTKDSDTSYQNITAKGHRGLDERWWTRRQKSKDLRCILKIESEKCDLTSLFACSRVTFLVTEIAADSSLNVKTPLIISLESLHIKYRTPATLKC